MPGVIYGDDPGLGLNRPQFDIGIEWFSAIMIFTSLLATLFSAIISTIRFTAKKTSFLMIVCLYSITIFGAVLTNIVYVYGMTNFFVNFFYSAFLTGASFIFTIALAKTIRLVAVNAKTAEKYTTRWTIAHTVVHLLCATPLYLTPIANLIDDAPIFLRVVRLWGYASVAWFAYLFIYSIYTFIWLLSRIYEHTKKMMPNVDSNANHTATGGTSKTKSNDKLVKKKARMVPGYDTSSGTESNLNNNIQKKLVAIAKNFSAARVSVELYYHRARFLIISVIVLDIATIGFTLAFFLLPRVNGTVIARTSNACNQIACAMGGLHGVAANTFFDLLVAIFRVRNTNAASAILRAASKGSTNVLSPETTRSPPSSAKPKPSNNVDDE